MDDLCSRSGDAEGLPRRRREQGVGETDALSGLAGAGRLRLVQVQPGRFGAEPPVPGFRHSEVPLAIFCATHCQLRASRGPRRRPLARVGGGYAWPSAEPRANPSVPNEHQNTQAPRMRSENLQSATRLARAAYKESDKSP